MDEYKPLQKSNLIIKDLGDEFLIYSAEHKELHVINPTARLIWDMCDGNHTINDIKTEIQTRFAIPPDRDIISDIHSTLDTFCKKGLIEIDHQSE